MTAPQRGRASCIQRGYGLLRLAYAVGLSRGAPISGQNRHPSGALGAGKKGDGEVVPVLDVEKRAAGGRRSAWSLVKRKLVAVVPARGPR
jgi:hypothetical protein